MIARNRNELWGRVLMDELARCGLQFVIVSPGSRSTPLVLAAATDARLRVITQIDERSAGFMGLGVGKMTGAPAALITTSGTAVANLLPAVVEAAQSETPLVVLTADRPPWLRGADANQTIEQRGIFGGYVRFFEELFPGEVSERGLRHLRSVACRAIAAALGDPAGPVHLNLPFAKPLEPTPIPGDLPTELANGLTPGSGGRDGGEPWTRVRPMRPGPSEADIAYASEALSQARSPVLIAGVVPRPWEVGPVLRKAASTLGIPLLADVLSGSRYPGGDPRAKAAPVVGGYDLALSNSTIRGSLRPDLIIRFGSAPTSSSLASWLYSLEGVPHLVVSGGGRWKDHAGLATRLISADPARFIEALLIAEPDSLNRSAVAVSQWGEVEADLRKHVSGPLMTPRFEGSVVAEVARRIGSEDILFVSNSMPVRDVGTFVPSRERSLMVIGNRGASGIDGIVSTAAGVSLASGRRVVVITGDLALLHDSNGLSSLTGPGIRVFLVVLNNNGGGIFHFLPIREIEPAFTPLFATPHGRDLGVLAAFHGLPYLFLEGRFGRSVSASDTDSDGALDLDEAWTIAMDWEGSGMLEVRTDRDQNRARRAEVVEAISSAVGAGNKSKGRMTKETK